MHLDEIKTKHITNALGRLAPVTKLTESIEVDTVSEGADRLPKWVRLCVKAIEGKGDPKLKPVEICKSVYKRDPHRYDTRARERREEVEAAIALSKLTEELRKSRASHSDVVFEHIGQEPKGQQRQAVRYEQGGN